MLSLRRIYLLLILIFLITIISSLIFYRFFSINYLIYPEVVKSHEYIIKSIKTISNDKVSITKIDAVEFIKLNNDLINNIYNKKIFILSEKNIYNTEIYKTKNNLIHKIENFLFGQSDISENITKNNFSHQGIILSGIYDKNENNYKTKIITFIPIKDPFIHDHNEFLIVETDITNLWSNLKNFEKETIIFFCISTFIILILVFLYKKIIDRNILIREKKLSISEEENLQKSFFLANVSHELRTPLNSIIGFSESILSGAYGKLEHTQYLEYINDINNSGKHLLTIINDILDFSKASSDKLSVYPEKVNICKLVSSSLRFLKPKADSMNIKLIQKNEAENLVLYVDPKRMRQALLNILSNAVKFSKKNSNITVSISENIRKNKVIISVIDHGIGIAKNNLPKAFLTFEQIENSHNKKYPGTGLGLPLTKKLVELMKGKIKINSKFGSGTTVTMEFEKYEK